MDAAVFRAPSVSAGPAFRPVAHAPGSVLRVIHAKHRPGQQPHGGIAGVFSAPLSRWPGSNAFGYNGRVLKIVEDEGGVLLQVKIVPGASRTRFLGEWQGRARIAVVAPPEKGRANDAVCEFLAGLLAVSRRNVHVVSGYTSPLKTIRIDRTTADALRSALQPDRS